MSRCRLFYVVGARPNFMKIASMVPAMVGDGVHQIIVHTGQHYDDEMSAVFFRELDLPEPDISLGIGPGSHAQQTGRVMMALEQVMERERPDLVVVVGDVNSTLAGALVAAKLSIPLAHVEAGLRSFDRTMPEEINRLVTDNLSDFLFATEPSGVRNLRREGVGAEHIFLVGNVMVDTLLRLEERARGLTMHARLGLDAQGYGVVTVHRPGNVDTVEGLRRLLQILRDAASRAPLVYPVHPRTRARLRETGLEEVMLATPGVMVIPPLGYLEFVSLLTSARFVLTDSGGVQEETTALGIPCLTLRANTERPITVEEGTNVVVGTDPAQVSTEVDHILAGEGKRGRRPELWDGRAAERIAVILRGFLEERPR